MMEKIVAPLGKCPLLVIWLLSFPSSMLLSMRLIMWTTIRYAQCYRAINLRHLKKGEVFGNFGHFGFGCKKSSKFEENPIINIYSLVPQIGYLVALWYGRCNLEVPKPDRLGFYFDRKWTFLLPRFSYILKIYIFYYPNERQFCIKFGKRKKFKKSLIVLDMLWW